MKFNNKKVKSFNLSILKLGKGIFEKNNAIIMPLLNNISEKYPEIGEVFNLTLEEN